MAEESSIIEKIGRELAQAIDQAWLATRESTFPDMVKAYRKIEAEFVPRIGNQLFVLETRRRIAEAILRQANSTEQPFQVCQEAWNELMRLGFTNMERRSTMTWYYADCCLLEGQFDAGLAVLEPLIADTIRQIEEPTRADRSSTALKEDLVRLEELHAELKAGIRE